MLEARVPPPPQHQLNRAPSEKGFHAHLSELGPAGVAEVVAAAADDAGVAHVIARVIGR